MTLLAAGLLYNRLCRQCYLWYTATQEFWAVCCSCSLSPSCAPEVQLLLCCQSALGSHNILQATVCSELLCTEAWSRTVN